MLCNPSRTTTWIRKAVTSAASSALIALTGLSTSLMPAAAQAQEFVSIKGNSVNVREKPSTRSSTSGS